MGHKSYKDMTFEILPENFVDQVLKPLSSIGIGLFQIFYFTQFIFDPSIRGFSHFVSNGICGHQTNISMSKEYF